MTFSGCSSYRKDTNYYNEFADEAIYIQLDKTICIFLKTVRGAQLSIVTSLFALI